MTDNPRLLIGVLRAVARLALPAADQQAYLPGIGVGDLADELALDLQDAAGLGAQLGLTQTELDLVTAMDKIFEQMPSDDEQLWRAPGLSGDPRWEEVRRLAREFLFLQGQ